MSKHTKKKRARKRRKTSHTGTRASAHTTTHTTEARANNPEAAPVSSSREAKSESAVVDKHQDTAPSPTWEKTTYLQELLDPLTLKRFLLLAVILPLIFTELLQILLNHA